MGQLDLAMESVIRAVAAVSSRFDLPQPVITSGNDSRHDIRSLHYADRVLDFCGNNITVAQGKIFQDGVRGLLSKDYEIVFETFSNVSDNHLHVEHDPD